MRSILILLTTSTYLVSCIPPPHPAVVAVRREEELLPPYLRSRALHNPHLQEVLPLTSLLHRGENPVFEREADKVPRQEIYNILSHAGFVHRRPLNAQPDPFHRPHQRTSSHKHHHHGPQQHHVPPHHNFFDSPYFANPELLQHL